LAHRWKWVQNMQQAKQAYESDGDADRHRDPALRHELFLILPVSFGPEM
jgi:hypothetical protein